MKRNILLGLLLPTTVFATGSFADDKADCLDAASRGQRFRDTHKLVESREQLRVCAAARCPAVVRSDCATWLIDVEHALPTVVLSARNRARSNLTDVKVSVDGEPLASTLDGRAVPINAGQHTFRFESLDGATIDQRVLVNEGVKDQIVAVTIRAVQQAVPAGRPASQSTPDSNGASTPWRMVGWVTGGVGTAGIGVGTAFGLAAIAEKSAAHCNANNVCDPGTTGGIKGAALASDIGWVGGGLLLASGAALVLFAPHGSQDATAGVRIRPVVTATGVGAVVGTSW